MVKRIFSAAFNGLRKRVFVVDNRLQGENYILLLRLENLFPISARLGQTDLAQLMIQLVIRINAAHRADNSVQMVSQGVFSAVLEAQSEDEAITFATRLQKGGQQVITLAGQEITPVLTGILMPIEKANPHARSAAFQHAQDRLALLPDVCIGKIALVGQADSSKPQTDQSAIVPEFLMRPQICCHSGEVLGFAVSSASPDGSGCEIAPFTRKVLEAALDALTHWEAAGWQVQTVSICVSDSDICAPDFPDMVEECLQISGLGADRLVLTLTGPTGDPAEDDYGLCAALDRLTAAGCQLELADFGHGYGDLAMIHRFKVQRIRIGSGFTTDCNLDHNQQQMILAIFTLAECLDIRTIAEEITSQAEHSYLAQLGCDEVEGPVIAKSMPLSETFAFLSLHRQRAQTLPTIPVRKSR